MKKRVLMLTVAALAALMVPVTALAHGGRGGHHGWGAGTRSATAAPRYELCPVDDCEVYGPHQHNDSWYCNQNGGGYYGRGHGCYRW